ncbi:uncharacterized protein L969DRAFT_94606 [Mixia osmundae IAM 14324]|uniref:Uncharacterized protein n=1 Tax=Mixia osmundae (strain CBS 9802 / IAM 14324 / JCM 22182 / KY 12970) TaxID=764103 RepID=G7DVJ7_MIXOS|nr:uncharacterized protein L969DRAFT_94606 [Mixia osmundae IAM 14324]KEI39552.1 hypothetical protein L969DRAFT_94606 [Mixia osmundae IAM 14324]GAA94607.1 hypothetical protein E5Q_01259 [Mixia osmundae IAM 14324]
MSRIKHILLRNVSLLATIDQMTAWTVALQAAATDELALLEQLLDHGCLGVQAHQDEKSETILHAAVQRGSYDCLDLCCSRYPDAINWGNLLVQRGAEVDLPDLSGNTPLHLASGWGNVLAVKCLIEQGASTAIKNDLGWAAIDYAFSFTTHAAFVETVRDVFDVQQQVRKTTAVSAAAKARGLDTSMPIAIYAGSTTSLHDSLLNGLSLITPSSFGSGTQDSISVYRDTSTRPLLAEFDNQHEIKRSSFTISRSIPTSLSTSDSSILTRDTETLASSTSAATTQSGRSKRHRLLRTRTRSTSSLSSLMPSLRNRVTGFAMTIDNKCIASLLYAI